MDLEAHNIGSANRLDIRGLPKFQLVNPGGCFTNSDGGHDGRNPDFCLGGVKLEIHTSHLSGCQESRIGFQGRSKDCWICTFGHQYINTIYSHRTVTSLSVMISFNLDNNSSRYFLFILMSSFSLYLSNSYSKIHTLEVKQLLNDGAWNFSIF